MPAVVAVSRPVSSGVRVVASTNPVRVGYPYSYGYGYNYPYSYGYGYGYPYAYSNPYNYYNYGYGYPAYNNAYYSPYTTPIYQTTPVVVATSPSVVTVAAPASSTAYGTCSASSGVVTSNYCASGKAAMPVAGGCQCADQLTASAGCGNVVNGVCK